MNQVLENPSKGEVLEEEKWKGGSGEYRLDGGISESLYRAFDSKDQEVILKVADSGRLRREKSNLQTLLRDKSMREAAQPYFPQLLDRAALTTSTPVDSPEVHLMAGRGRGTGSITSKEALVFRRVPNLFSLRQVREAYPDGVNPRDMAWILRRLLMALGYVHAAGLVHASVTPDHILIEPHQHGLILASFSRASDGSPTEVTPGWEDITPSELKQEKDLLPPTDIFMAVKSMQWLIEGQDTPKRMRAFFQGCVQAQIERRPRGAWDLKDEFDELLFEMWGKRKFRPFEMPSSEVV